MPQLVGHHRNGFRIQIWRWHLVWSCTFLANFSQISVLSTVAFPGWRMLMIICFHWSSLLVMKFLVWIDNVLFMMAGGPQALEGRFLKMRGVANTVVFILLIVHLATNYDNCVDIAIVWFSDFDNSFYLTFFEPHCILSSSLPSKKKKNRTALMVDITSSHLLNTLIYKPLIWKLWNLILMVYVIALILRYSWNCIVGCHPFPNAL